MSRFAIVIGMWLLCLAGCSGDSPQPAVSPATVESPRPPEPAQQLPEPVEKVNAAEEQGPAVVESAPPQPEPPKPAITPVVFDIQGMRIGDRLTEEWAYSHCPAKDKGKPDITGSDSFDIGGSSVFVHFQFDDFKLAGVTLGFEPAAFDALVKAYTTKFGTEPHSVSTDKVRNALGAEFTNLTVRWETDSGPFTIMKYGGSLTRGIAMLDSPQIRNYRQRKQAESDAAVQDKL